MQKKLHIKAGDIIRVIAGEHKGKEAKVLSVDGDKNRAIVEGINLVKKHKKPDASSPQGGIIEKEAGIHISNLMIVVNGETTRVGRKHDDKGKLVRYAKSKKLNGEVIE